MEKQTRERALLEELFADHFKLADRFDETAGMIDRVFDMLRGSEGSRGVIAALQDACDALSPIAGGELEKKVAALIRQSQALPERLVRIADEEGFRLGVRNAFTDLFEEVVEATRNAGIEITSRELESLVKRAAQAAGDTVFGDAALNAAKLSRAEKEVENLKAQNLVLMDTLSTREQLSEQAVDKLGKELGAVSEKLAAANSRRFGFSGLAAAFALGIYLHGPVISLVNAGIDLQRETAKAATAAERRPSGDD
ncbi:hypothetical protein ACM79P_29460 [Pseudomonas aeruginosa]